MKKLKDLPIDEVDALTYAQECFDGPPIHGTHYGAGLHVAMPDTVNDDDVRSGDPTRWIGWTHSGPTSEIMFWLTDARISEIEADNGEHIPDASKRAKAKNAIKKAQEPTKVIRS